MELSLRTIAISRWHNAGNVVGPGSILLLHIM